MIIALHRGYGFQAFTSDLDPAVKIAALTRLGVADGVQVEREAVDGDIYPSLTTLLAHNESFELESLNVDSVIDMVGAAGQCLNATDNTHYVEVYASKIDPCSPGANTGAVNMRYRATGPVAGGVFGLMTPGSLTCEQGQNARMSWNTTPISSDGNAAIAVTDSVALPASMADTKNRFTIAEEFSFGGVDFKSKKSLSINFGVSLFTEKADDALSPEFVAIENAQPMVRISGPSLHWALDAGIPRAGRLGTHANSIFYLKKRDPSSASGYVANGTAEHIKITVNGKAFMTQLVDASGNGTGQAAIDIYPERDSSGNVPIIMQTEVAIP